MTQIVETTQPLTDEERRQVQHYAEFLISRRNGSSAKAAPEKYMDVDSVAGMFAGLAPEKSDVELQHEASDIIAAKYDPRT